MRIVSLYEFLGEYICVILNFFFFLLLTILICIYGGYAVVFIDIAERERETKVAQLYHVLCFP